jgi:hypothetical protein
MIDDFILIPWDLSGAYRSDNMHKSFLFSLKNSHNGEAIKFSMSHLLHAIYCDTSYGPTFESCHDLLSQTTVTEIQAVS